MPQDPAIATPEDNGAKDRVSSWSKWLLICGILILLLALLLPARRSAPEAGRRMRCSNNLLQILQAVDAYRSNFGSFPPAFTTDPTGRRLHSWRTLILPFLDHEGLYRKIDLARPWDDPVNAEALRSMPSVYRCPKFSGAENTTCYLAMVGAELAFSPDHARKREEFTDGLDQTVLIIEAPTRSPIPWMAPEDSDGRWFEALDNSTETNHPGGMNVGFADLHVSFLQAKFPRDLRRRILTIAGSDRIDVDESDDSDRPVPVDTRR